MLNITEILSNNKNANMSYQSGRTDNAKDKAVNAAFNVMLQALPMAASQPEPQVPTPAAVVEKSTPGNGQKVENAKPAATTNITEQPQRKTVSQAEAHQPNQPANAVHRDEAVKSQLQVNTNENKVVQAMDAQSVAPAVQRDRKSVV